MRNKLLLSLTVLGCLLVATTMSAQATRTWVSGVGDDVNPCSRTAPCKTFAGAISKTATCGEINVLDSAGYGTVTITKSITINGEGAHASILNGGNVNGIVVNIQANVNDLCNTVILRHLSINGVPTGGLFGLNGIRDLTAIAHSLHIEHVDITNQQRGILVDTNNAGTKVFMKDVDVRHTTVHGIDIHPAGGQTVTLSMHDVRSRQSAGDGIRYENNAKGTVTESQFQQNSANGVNIFGSSVSMTFIDTDISNNGQTGLVNAAGSTTFIDGCSFFGNGNGGINNTGSVMNGFGNNSFGNNTGGDVIGTPVVTLGHP